MGVPFFIVWDEREKRVGELGWLFDQVGNSVPASNELSVTLFSLCGVISLSSVWPTIERPRMTFPKAWRNVLSLQPIVVFLKDKCLLLKVVNYV